MKKILFFIVLSMLISCKSKNGVAKSETAAIVKLPLTEANEDQKDRITSLGKQILMTCNTSKFKPLTEKEATPEVRKNMTIDRLTKTCLKFRLKYGDFKDLKFIEAYQNKKENTIIYRYKALYEKKIANKELRITVNPDNQIAAVNSKDWVDAFHN